MPCSSDSRRPKNTASNTVASAPMSTAETSKSHSPASVSHPRPTKIRAKSAGKSRTLPFSMANATFWRCGAEGMNVRMTSESKGRMSMKCWPPSAGRSITRNRHPLPAPSVRTIAATTSTEPALCSISSRATSLLSLSSMTCNLPLATSCSDPPEYAATTKISIRTLLGIFRKFAQTISETCAGLPTDSSPECVMALTAFMLL
mmetsp:Transcript_135898/g.338931  ORF Transcript_135898/g.338931 Transcript_135898/m.338931 type:complete len:203 (+) Transcript_135898:500-1108(+)